MNISVVLLTLNEAPSLQRLLPEIRKELDGIGAEYEVIVVDGGSNDGTQEVAMSEGARLIFQKRPGYGGALVEGLRASHGEYIITLDSDGSHPPQVLTKLWEARNSASVVIASRYILGGSSEAPLHRRVLSSVLNQLIRIGLSIPVRDASSGYRLYSRQAVQTIQCQAEDFDVLLEILVRLYAEGYSVNEIPLVYHARRDGRSNAHIFRFGVAYLVAISRMWKLRNSVESADYDDRAFDSRIPLQRYWQRQRYRIIMRYLGRFADLGGGYVLDVGCGSSRIIQGLPHAVAFELSKRKLRFLSKSNTLRVNGRTQDLPFRDRAFDAVIHSEVLEHVPFDKRIFSEINRVLKLDGIAIVGTPDYGRIWWPMIEYVYGKLMPNAYADEHITHFTRHSLVHELAEHGFRIVEYSYICGGELIVKAVKVEELSHTER